MNASGGVPMKMSSAAGVAGHARGKQIADRQHVAMEMHRALGLAGRAGGEGDQADIVGSRVAGCRTPARLGGGQRVQRAGGRSLKYSISRKPAQCCSWAGAAQQAVRRFSRTSHSAAWTCGLVDDVPVRARAAAAWWQRPPARP